MTRVPFVMGEDGYLPKALFKVHTKYGTPWVALVVSSAIYSVFILGPFQSLVVVDVTIYAAALTPGVLGAGRPPDQGARHETPVQDPGRVAGDHPRRAWDRSPSSSLAVYDQVCAPASSTTVGLAVLFLATGPILYPIARYFKKRRGETDVFAPAGITEVEG